MAQWQASYHIEFLVSIVNIVNTVNKPRITIGIRVSEGNRLSTLQGQDEIFRVEHVQHWIDAVTINLCHVTSSLTDSFEDTVHLW